MPETVYRDLAEFGLPFITPEDPAFAPMVRDIQSRPLPFGPEVPTGSDAAAVLVNQSGKSIVALAYVWRQTTSGGESRPHWHANLGSSQQLDVLTGRAPVTRDQFSFILPGSKRLITEDGMFGDNLDVLPADAAPHGGGRLGFAGRGASRWSQAEVEVERVELQLDAVFFDDGLCAGPDESDLFGSVTDDLERQRQISAEIVEALRNGATVGHAFELLRPFARHGPPPPAPASHGRRHSILLPMFARMALQRLIDGTVPEVLAWFEDAARPYPIQLHRPA